MDTIQVNVTDIVEQVTVNISSIGERGPIGPQGTQGPIGETGPQGPAGLGLPAGGTIGQVVKKKSSTNYDTEWGDDSAVNFETNPANIKPNVEMSSSNTLNGVLGSTGNMADAGHQHPTDPNAPFKMTCAMCVAPDNITLSGLQTLDGYTTKEGDSVLVIGQSDPKQNGMYVASAGLWVRRADCTDFLSIGGAVFSVDNGADYGGVIYHCQNSENDTWGLTPVSIVAFPSATVNPMLKVYANGNMDLSIESNVANLKKAGSASLGVQNELIRSDHVHPVNALGDLLDGEGYILSINGAALSLVQSGGTGCLGEGPFMVQTSSNTWRRLAGSCYVSDNISVRNLVSWEQADFDMSSLGNGANYIRFDINGDMAITQNPVYDTSLYAEIGYIFTGFNNTVILAIINTPKYISKFPSRILDFITECLGSLVSSGCGVSVNGLGLHMSGGVFWAVSVPYELDESTTFYKVYNTTDQGWVFDLVSPVNLINNHKYNDVTKPASSALVDIPTGYFKQDIVFRIPSGDTFVVYGQTVYPDETSADKGAIATLPDTLENVAIILAKINVQQGNSTIDPSWVYDMRPNFARVFGFGSSSAGSVLSHHSLADLNDGDDHYLIYFNQERGDARYAQITNGVTNGNSHAHHSGDGAQIAYADLSGLPTLGTAAAKDVPSTGNASASQVVYGTDTRLTDSRVPESHGNEAHTSTFITQSSAVAPNTAITPATVFSLVKYDAKGLVISGESATADNISDGTNTHLVTTAQQTLINNAEQTSNKGQASGYCGLDSGGKVPLTNLPSTLMEYQGSWNPTTNTPTLSDSSGTNGYVYWVSAAQATAVSGLSDPSMVNFQIGDLIIYSSGVGKWQLVTPAAGVRSVNGLQGAVNLSCDNINDGTNYHLVTTAQKTILGNTSGTNSGDETKSSIETKLGITDAEVTAITNLSGTNSGDETASSIKTKLGIITLTGSNTGDETASSIETKLSVTSANITALASLSGTNTGDETNSSIITKIGFTPQAALVSGTNIKTVQGGSSLLGSGDLTIYSDDTIVTAYAKLPTQASEPAAAAASSIKLYSKTIAGKNFAKIRGSGTYDDLFALQQHIAFRQIGFWNPSGNSATAPPVTGLLAFTALGTATARTVATTSFFTRQRRIGYVSSATAGNFAGVYTSAAQYTIGDGSGNGGFFLVMRFGTSDAAAVSGARQFVGISSSVATASNVEPNTLVNSIGVGHGASDTSLSIYYGGSAAQTPIALGSNFPANTLSTDVYELVLFSSPGANNSVGYRVTRLNTGQVAEGTLSAATPGTQLPSATTLLALRGWRTNNATALAVGLDLNNIYLETQ